ncbi:hypothetical protein D9M71_824640 [compost metagenome]
MLLELRLHGPQFLHRRQLLDIAAVWLRVHVVADLGQGLACVGLETFAESGIVDQLADQSCSGFRCNLALTGVFFAHCGRSKGGDTVIGRFDPECRATPCVAG